MKKAFDRVFYLHKNSGKTCNVLIENASQVKLIYEAKAGDVFWIINPEGIFSGSKLPAMIEKSVKSQGAGSFQCLSLNI